MIKQLPVNMTYKTAMQIFGLKEESVHKFLTLTHKFYDEVPQSLSMSFLLCSSDTLLTFRGANLKDIEQAFSGAHHEKLVVSYSLSAIMASSIAAELKRLDAIKKDYQEYVFEPGTIVNLCGHVPLRAAYTLRLPREGGENVLMVVMEGKRGEADSAEGTLVSFMGKNWSESPKYSPADWRRDGVQVEEVEWKDSQCRLRHLFRWSKLQILENK